MRGSRGRKERGRERGREREREREREGERERERGKPLLNGWQFASETYLNKRN
jgi:hypothetical protein